MQLSEVTKDVIHDWLRGFRKGFGIDLSQYMSDVEYTLEERQTVIRELCVLSGDDYNEVTSMGI